MTNDLPSNPYEGEPLSDQALGLSDEEGKRIDETPPAEAPLANEEREQASDIAHLHVDTLVTGPIFVLFAKDLVAPKLVRHWADLQMLDANCTPQRRAEARRIAMAMELWQKDRGIAP